MECTLAALIACFSWSGLYIDTGAVYSDTNSQIASVVFVRNARTTIVNSVREDIITDSTSRTLSDREFGSFGRIALGYDIHPTRNVSVALEASYMKNDEYEIRSVFLNVRFRPFAN